jgi:hypothetical protein
MHYQRWRTHGDPTVTLPRPAKNLCSIDGCQKLATRRGWCSAHYMRWLTNGDPIAGGGRRPLDVGHGWVYVVTDDDRATVKLGITTSARPDRRLASHKRDGLPVVLRVWELGDGQAATARRIEADALALLDLAGWEPKRGREYFDGAATADVLAVLDALTARHQAEVDQ